MIQRLERSSRSPVLRFAELKEAATTIAAVATTSAMRAGLAKNASNPPQPNMARPRKMRTPPAEASANVGLDMTPMWAQSA